MKKLTKKQIIMLHEMLIESSGGSPEIRDEGLLDSAVNAPFQSFGEHELYPSLLEKAARLGFGLIMNHPFVDGNKRIGAHAMLIFLEINNHELEYKDTELIELILGIASGKYACEYLLEWLKEHMI